MSSQQRAAFLDGPSKPLRIDHAEIPKPGSNEILVQNKAIAINPVDWKIQDYGIFIQNWPSIIGEDIAGQIAAVGDGVKRFTVGQRVLGHCLSLSNGDIRQGAFQEYSIISQDAASALPDNMSFEQASVLPLSISTAAAGLFQKSFLGLPYPTTSAKPGEQSLLIWGGSSSVGLSAIQLGVAAGLKVVTTCSSHNSKLCESLGAKTFDYNSPSEFDVACKCYVA